MFFPYYQGDAIPRVIDVTLETISCDRNGFGGSVLISGNIFGATFQDNPDDPNDLRDQRSIFPFPSGPISFSKGQTVPITMLPAAFVLHQTFDTEQPLSPRFLKIGGDLNLGLGSSFLRYLIPKQFLSLVRYRVFTQRHQGCFRWSLITRNSTFTLTFALIAKQV